MPVHPEGDEDRHIDVPVEPCELPDGIRLVYADDDRDEGLIGLADKRALRSQTPGATVDPRVVAAIEKMLADPVGRSTVARSVMFTELQRKLGEAHGPGEVPMPSRATFYRVMSHMDRGRRNFISEASRRMSVIRPDRPFTPVTALRPGEDCPPLYRQR